MGALVLGLVTACWAPTGEPPDGPPVYEVGTASWYGEAFAGQATASGELYEPDARTAAHPRLPFGTEVEVTRTGAGEGSVVVRVNDRGPFTGGRIIDVSRAAAVALGMVDEGTAAVALRIVRCPPGEDCTPGSGGR